MAGTAESGIEAAQRDLFTDAAYVLTPVERTPTPAVQMVEDVVRPLRTRIYRCRPADHDRAVAWISHLPVIASASLIAACLEESDPTVLELAKLWLAPVFEIPAELGWKSRAGIDDGAVQQSFLVRSLHVYQEQLNQLITQVEHDDWSAFEEVLQQTQQARPEFLKRFDSDGCEDRGCGVRGETKL